MTRIDHVKGSIDELYLAKNEGRAEWADWLHAHHVFVVAENVAKLAERFGAKKDLAMAAAMLHDVADAVMSRFDPRHPKESLTMARTLLTETGFSDEEIHTIVEVRVDYERLVALFTELK